MINNFKGHQRLAEVSLKCYNCNHSFGLHDLKKTKWIDTFEQFYFICSSCRKENKIISNIFSEGHINENYLMLCKDDNNILPKKQRHIILEHLSKCEFCRRKMDNLLVDEIENNIRFNQLSENYLDDYGTLIAKNLDSKNIKFEIKNGNIHIREFTYNDIKYFVNESLEFCRKKDKLIENSNLSVDKVYYYLFKNDILIGLASFILHNSRIVLEKIWTKSSHVLDYEEKFIDDFKNKKIDLKLSTIKGFCF